MARPGRMRRNVRRRSRSGRDSRRFRRHDRCGSVPACGSPASDDEAARANVARAARLPNSAVRSERAPNAIMRMAAARKPLGQVPTFGDGETRRTLSGCGFGTFRTLRKPSDSGTGVGAAACAGIGRLSKTDSPYQWRNSFLFAGRSASAVPRNSFGSSIPSASSRSGRGPGDFADHRGRPRRFSRWLADEGFSESAATKAARFRFGRRPQFAIH